MSRELFYQAFLLAHRLELLWPGVYDQLTPVPQASMSFSRAHDRMVLVWPGHPYQWRIISVACQDVCNYELRTDQAVRLHVRLIFDEGPISMEELKIKAMERILKG